MSGATLLPPIESLVGVGGANLLLPTVVGVGGWVGGGLILLLLIVVRVGGISLLLGWVEEEEEEEEEEEVSPCDTSPLPLLLPMRWVGGVARGGKGRRREEEE